MILEYFSNNFFYIFYHLIIKIVNKLHKNTNLNRVEFFSHFCSFFVPFLLVAGICKSAQIATTLQHAQHNLRKQSPTIARRNRSKSPNQIIRKSPHRRNGESNQEQFDSNQLYLSSNKDR